MSKLADIAYGQVICGVDRRELLLNRASETN